MIPLDPPPGVARPSRLSLLVATGLGLGYAPVASGTFGSLPGLVLVRLLWELDPWAVLAGLAGVTALGWWAAGAVAPSFGRSDPGQVVIDEVAGQMVSLLFFAPTLLNLAAGFFLFRLFDVLKPPPARRLEGLPGASGIMADDLVAGLYANGALWAMHWAFPTFWGS